jgi:hypothetical protein
MVTIKKVTEKDFEKLLPLLFELDSRKQTQDEWLNLFRAHWDDNENYFGYVMYDGKNAVGFLGLLFSERTLNNNLIKFCNVTSWVVKKKYRRQSLHLFYPVLELDNHTITVLTCNTGTHLIMKKLGFIDLEIGQRIIFPIPISLKFNSSTKIIFDLSEIEKKLKGEELKIFNDHRSLNCFHVMICGPEGECYLIGSRTIKKNIPLAHVHYISDHRFFSSHINSISGRICWRMKVLGILVDERQLHGETIFPSIYFNLPHPRVYKSDTLKSEEIDLLYSEYQILNL